MSDQGGPRLQALLGMSQSSCTLPEAKPLGTKVLCIATCECETLWIIHRQSDASIIHTSECKINGLFRSKPRFADQQNQKTEFLLLTVA